MKIFKHCDYNTFHIIEISLRSYRLLKLYVFMKNAYRRTHSGIDTELRSGSPVRRIALTHGQENSYQSVQSSKWRRQRDQSPLSVKQLRTTLRASRFHLAFTIALQSIRAQLPFTYRSTSAIAVRAQNVVEVDDTHENAAIGNIFAPFIFFYILSLSIIK